MDTNFFTKVADNFAYYFIEAHKMGIDMIMKGKNHISDDLVDGIIMMGLGVLLIVLFLVIDLSIIYGICSLLYRISIRIRTKEIKRNPVVGKVVDKKYQEEHTTYIYNGCSLTPIFYPEEYNISVQYGKLKVTFDNKNLFNQYEEGDSISLILVQKLNRKGKVIGKTLE